MSMPIKCNNCHYLIEDNDPLQAKVGEFWTQYKKSTHDIPPGIGFCPKCLSGVMVPLISSEQLKQFLQEIGSIMDDRILIKTLNQEIELPISKNIGNRLNKFLYQILSNIDKIALSYFYLNQQKD